MTDVFKTFEDQFNPFKIEGGWAERINARIKVFSDSPPDEENPYLYLGSCVVLDGYKINAMFEGAQKITLKTLRKHCDTTPFELVLGYGRSGKDVLRLSKDYHVGYYKSHYDGRPCYFIVHSAIEYIWTLQPENFPGG